MMSREEFLERRRSGIGGSDIGAIAGLSPYSTPLDVWLSKTNQSQDQSGNEEAMYWGTVLEGAVADRYSEVTGNKVQRINAMLRHPEVQIAVANIDRAVINPSIAKAVRVINGHKLSTDRIWEGKTANAFAMQSGEWGDAGTDLVPGQYLAQVMWYLGISGAQVADLSCLFGGQKHVTYTIQFDAELFGDLLQMAAAWWQRHVVEGIMPDPRTADEARRVWPQHIAGKRVVVDVAVADAIKLRADFKKQISEIEKMIEPLEDRIFPAVADADEVVCNGSVIATYRANKPSQRIDWPAVAAAAAVPADIIAANTTMKPGARVLRVAKSKE